MVKMLPLTPCAGLLPITVDTVSLNEVVVDHVISIAPFAGQKKAVSATLKDQIGVGLAPMNRVVAKAGVAVQWFGHETWLVRGQVMLDGLAAVTDQSDAWAIVRTEGVPVEDVLARLIPLDLRAATFKTGHTARSMLGHMSCAVIRVSDFAFEVMVMRSMASTLVHELEMAAQSVAARGSNF